MKIDSSKTLYSSTSKTTKILPSSLSLAHSNICWQSTSQTYPSTLPSSLFSDEITFNSECPNQFLKLSNQSVGTYSLTSLAQDYYSIMSKWYSDSVQFIKAMNLNQHDTKSFEQLGDKFALQAKLESENAKKNLDNYQQLMSKTFASFDVFSYTLIGVNKACFKDSSTYEEIWGLGWVGELFKVESFSFNKAGIESEAISENSLNEDQTNFSILNNFSADRRSKKYIDQFQENNNLHITKPNKTSKSLTSLKDLHSLAADSVFNVYKLNSKLAPLLLTMIILSILFLFFTSVSEYDYQTSKQPTCSKIFYSIIITLLFMGLLTAQIILLIINTNISGLFLRIQNNSCLDPSIISLIQGDLPIQGSLTLLAVGLLLLLLSGLSGLLFVCRLCGKRKKYRLWRSPGRRFA